MTQTVAQVPGDKAIWDYLEKELKRYTEDGENAAYYQLMQIILDKVKSNKDDNVDKIPEVLTNIFLEQLGRDLFDELQEIYDEHSKEDIEKAISSGAKEDLEILFMTWGEYANSKIGEDYPASDFKTDLCEDMTYLSPGNEDLEKVDVNNQASIILDNIESLIQAIPDELITEAQKRAIDSVYKEYDKPMHEVINIPEVQAFINSWAWAEEE